MKKLLIVFFNIIMLMPLHAFDFERKIFDFGFGVNAGFDNDIISINDFLSKNIILDLTKIGGDIGDKGGNINIGTSSEVFHVDVYNIEMLKGIWQFGLFANVDGGINLNIPKSLFTLITEGNKNATKPFTGTISASGSVFADAGIRLSAKYQIMDKNLTVGFTPSLYTPLAYVSNDSGIKYKFLTEDVISFSTSGSVLVYSPFLGNMDNFKLNFGFDVALNGEYAFFNFLDAGGSISNIPIARAEMNTGMQYEMVMKDKDGNVIDRYAPDLLGGLGGNGQSGIDFPKIELDETKGKINAVKVFRPLRFDVYALFRPLVLFSINPEWLGLVLKPNLGFSVDVNDAQGYFNFGLDAQVSFINLFFLHIGLTLQEDIWMHRLGFVLNLRAFELNVETVLRSQSFAGGYKMRGLGATVGIVFGW